MRFKVGTSGALFAALIVASASGDVLYVDHRAPAGGSGTSWAAPLRSISAAVTVAIGSGGRINEIRLGPGVYVPDSAITLLPPVVLLRGGHAGFGAPNPNARDALSYRTVLSADRLANDGPGFTNYGDNWQWVLRSTVQARVTCEDLTIRGSTSMGVKLDVGGELTFVNCELIDHQNGIADASSGAVTVRGGRLAASGVGVSAGSVDAEGVLVEDIAQTGLGLIVGGGLRRFRLADSVGRRIGTMVSANGVSIVIDGCVLDSCGKSSLRASQSVTVTDTNFLGAGSSGLNAVCDRGVTISRCAFTALDATVSRHVPLEATSLDGTGIVEDLRFERCIGLATNLATTQGCAVRRCVFSDNTDIATALTVTNMTGVLTLIEDCAFVGNRGTAGPAGVQLRRSNANGEITMRRCRFERNEAGPRGAAFRAAESISDYEARVSVESCDFIGNRLIGQGLGGAVFAPGPSISFADCRFIGNAAPEGDGGAIAIEGDDDGVHWAARLARCVLVGNSARYGGAVRLNGSTSTPVDTRHVWIGDSLLAGNTASVDGGALYGTRVAPRLSNCTVVGNTAARWGGGLSLLGCEGGGVASSILWNNRDQIGRSQVAQFHDSDWGPGRLPSAAFSNSTVMGWTGTFGPFSRSDGDDPLFTDALGADGEPATGDEDYTLRPGSPAIDAGVNLSIARDWEDADGDLDREEPNPFALGRTPRRADDPLTPDRGSGAGPIVDRGCYERLPARRCPADLNGDGFIDSFDYDHFVAAFESGLSESDVNADGFLDPFDYADFVTMFELGC